MSIPAKQVSRPFKIEVFGLQDNYIATLQPFSFNRKGQIVSPKISISDDGSQTFTCSIPRYYIDEATNLKIENPRWRDIENGILAENTRVLKVFVDYGEEGIEVYPFRIDTIVKKRDNDFSTYREITANGLAFTELGKTGYKIELSQTILEKDYEADPELRPTLQYWLDQVFPNERNEEGEITKWLTPWCYEISMDWSGYMGGDRRDSTQVYENNYVDSWTTGKDKDDNLTLVPGSVSYNSIKARIVECKESNKYNITQDLAEAFEVFCEYKYKTNQRGEFIKTYIENGKAWTGRKVIFHNKGIKYDDALVLDYEKNLNTISVTSDATEIYSKLYVKPIESEYMTNGYITIADSSLNPTGEDYILNFDYMLASGAINEYQYDKVKQHEAQLHEFNISLRENANQINELSVEINNLEADVASIEKAIDSLEKSYQNFYSQKEASITNDSQEVTSSHPYQAIFRLSQDGIYYQSTFGSNYGGVNANTLISYNDHNCKNQVFDANNIIGVQNGIGSNAEKIYAVLDEFGYVTQLNIPVENSSQIFTKDSHILYLTFMYSPYNKYEAECQKVLRQIDAQKNALAAKKKELEDLKEEFSSLEKGYNTKLAEKKEAIMRFERMMGPALQEGYWSAEDYEDAGETISAQTNNSDNKISFIFDSKSFSGEILPYYYSEVSDEGKATKTYFNALEIEEKLYGSEDFNTTNAIIKATVNEFIYNQTKDEYKGYFYLIIDSKRYYTQKEITVQKNAEWILKFDTNGYPILTINKINQDLQETPPNEIDTNSIFNITSVFNGLSSILTSRTLFPHAGFEYAYINVNGTIKAAALLNDQSIDYSSYGNYTLFFNDNDASGVPLDSFIKLDEESNILVYPRIELQYLNINSDADSYKIAFTSESEVLTKYEDYSILIRGTNTYTTLKTTEANPIKQIMSKNYYISFQVSHANDQLYLDAKQVAKDNSQPKLSYSISVANTPDNTRKIILGQMVFINDYSIDVHRAPGYISGITLMLDSPKEDELTIANYKTKFEDLFSTITASSEAMKNNKRSYDLASNAFVGGQLSGSILQQALINNNVSLSFSKTNVNMTDGDGIVLTNTSPYTNGVYGQVVLRGGGIYCSSDIDDAGNRIWNSAITPQGINANYITTGHLDTNQIRIFAGDDMAFQWNEDGIFAYRRAEDGGVDLSTYVRYSYNGLEYKQGDFTAVSLGWNGLRIAAQNGAVQLTGGDGLTVYNSSNYKVAQLGKKKNEELYGLRLYDGSKEENITFYSTNEGNLWLKSYLGVGSGEENAHTYSGISGEETFLENGAPNNKDIRFWAGAENYDKRAAAPFIVYEDGSFIATSGNIGGVQIGKLKEELENYTVQIVSSSGLTFQENSTVQTILLAQIYKDGTLTTTVPKSWGTIEYRWFKGTPNTNVEGGIEWSIIEGETKNIYTVSEMKDGHQYRCEIWGAISEEESQ